MKYKISSFFTGAGGLDLGFEGGFSLFGKFFKKTLFKTVFSCDVSKHAKIAFDSFWENRSKLKMTEKSIVDLVKSAEKGEFKFEESDVVIGGFPCNDFSLAGKRLLLNSNKDHFGKISKEINANENRGMLYLWMVKAVGLIKPKVFIAENVKGMLSAGDVANKIKQDFEDVGYTVFLINVNAADYGVPQSRERIFFIGFNKEKADKEFLENLILNENLLYPETKEPCCCKDALSDLQEPEFSNDIDQQNYSKAKFIAKKCQGQVEIDMNGFSPTIRAEHHGNIEYRRLSLDHGGKNLEELENGLKERRLTIRECARLQCFPDEYKFIQKGVSASSAYRLIGNAVPCLLAHCLARKIEEIMKKLFKEDSI